ncbi:MAG: thioredoxin family protein [Brevundimonas sp.]
MKIRILAMAAASALVLAACNQPAEAPADATETTATAEAAGQMAPDFTLVNAEGEQVSLSDFRGRVVVLEWTNEDCPYVRKYYTGPMQDLQRQVVEDGAVWLTVISSAPGTQGYVEGEQARQWRSEYNANFTHLLADPTGETGRAYGAVTTPDMRVIDEDGRVIFTGGIDDRPSADVATLDGATNYVRAALDDHAAGRPVATPFAQPYGCSIKYADELEETA